MEIDPVVISYKDITFNKDLSAQISAAFGATGLGLIAIKDLPDFQEEREAALRAIYKFATLPEAVRERYSHEKSNFSLGWSHGKERMRNGIPDIAKGSYYSNPVSDVCTDDEVLKAKFPEIYSDNIWPRDVLPELETSCKAMTQIQLDVGYKMCTLFDAYLTAVTAGKHEAGTITAMLKRGMTYKARLLHYYPLPPEANLRDDALCGWHLDHGAITILLCPRYLDTEGNEIPAPPDCGLHIKHPVTGEVVKVVVPPDHLVVQLGESLQFLSGGHLRATAHCVRSSRQPGITRQTLAVFMDSNPEEPFVLPEYSLSFDDVTATPHLPPGVPTLRDRIQGVTCYRDFAVKTVRAYYNESVNALTPVISEDDTEENSLSDNIVTVHKELPSTDKSSPDTVEYTYQEKYVSVSTSDSCICEVTNVVTIVTNRKRRWSS